MFDEDRYWSVEVTYAKASPTEVLARIEVENHGPDEATLDVLPTLWFRNTWAWSDGTGRPRIERDGDGPLRRRSRAGGLPARGRTGAWRRGSRDALLRERDQCAAHLRVGGDHTVPERWDQRPRHRRSGDRQPGRARDEGGAALPAHRACRWPGRGAAATSPAGQPGRDGNPRLVERRLRHGRERPGGRTRTSSTARSRRRAPRRTRCRSCARPAPGSSGASRSTRTTCAAGSTEIRASRRRPRHTVTAATAAGAISTHSTSSRCRTRGSTRGSPPGIRASTRWHGRTSIPRSRSTRSSSSCASGSCIPTARCPRTNGTSTTSIRRSMSWRRCACSRSTEAGTARSSSASSRSCS